MNWTVWTWPCSKRYYLTHPWEWVSQFICNLKAAHDRATKGYCSLDWSNFDEWFISVTPRMLRDMADHGYGYPGSEPFETPEKWHAWLHKIADDLSFCDEQWAEEHCYKELNERFNKAMETAANRSLEKMTPEEKKRYDDNLMGYPCELNEEEKKIRDEYFDKWKQYNEERNEKIKTVLAEMSEHWFALWD